ncbi:hypothetical protein MKK75_00990 [Methylobacterium sp. J-030]|uniref:hypothetical protein n=1 Tax=Methylobacterium sp. J-030 TaxID=2836627 RepID=UPI001FB9563F|nr:hypothetical protein [Methylobacterium sp. J-030]MCJ2067391.1 hypothetical protein [Methylobacterium sp. J-030]
MSKTVLAAAISAVLATSALAQGAPGVPNLSHNGSAMRLDVVGEKVTIRYAQPRPGLAEAGVYPGAVLFTGIFQGDVIVGQAVAFKARCSPAPYNVGGRIEAGRFVLVGLGPHRVGCVVKDYLANSPHSRLPFEVTDQATLALLANQADPKRTRTAAEMMSVLRPGANREPSPAAMRESAPAPAPAPAPVPAPTPQVQAQAQAPAPPPVPFVPVAPLPRTETVTPSAPPSPKVAEVPVPPPSAPAPMELRTSEAAPSAPVAPNPSVAVAPAPQPKVKPKLDADL